MGIIRKLLFLSLLTINVYAVDYCADGNCQACWLMETGSGTTIADTSANTNTGNFANSPHWENTTPNPPAAYSTYYIEFDGNIDTDYINCGSNASIDLTQKNVMTVVAWANVTSETADRTIVRKSNDESDGVTLTYDAGNDNWHWRMKDNNWDYAKYSQASTTDGQWYHLAGIDDGTNIEIYADGVIGATTDTSGTKADASAGDLWIGGSTNESRYFVGYIDEVAIFDDELSSTEINDIMDNGLTPAVGTDSPQVIVISKL